MPSQPHIHQKLDSVACGVLSISDTRTPETDASGSIVRDLLVGDGHTIHTYRIIRDDPDQIRAAVIALRDDPTCNAVLLTGGTGLSARDTTYEVVADLIDKRLDGFGELFRAKSYERIGPPAMLSRAVAGAAAATAVFSIPGSTDAVQLAMNELILPVLGHVVHLLTRD